jgi:hypothetical protein
MRIYKNNLRAHGWESHGYTYHASYRAARASAAEVIRHTADSTEPIATVETEALDLTPTKSGIISALNQHGGHPDNG